MAKKISDLYKTLGTKVKYMKKQKGGSVSTGDGGYSGGIS